MLRYTLLLLLLNVCNLWAAPPTPSTVHSILGEWLVADPLSGMGWSVTFDSDQTFTGRALDFRKSPPQGAKLFGGRYRLVRAAKIQMDFDQSSRSFPSIRRVIGNTYNYKISLSRDEDAKPIKKLVVSAFDGCGTAYELLQLAPP